MEQHHAVRHAQQLSIGPVGIEIASVALVASRKPGSQLDQ